MTPRDPAIDRRPIAARQSAWAQRAAAALVRANVPPDAISLASVVFAALGAWALLAWPGIAGLLACAAGSQLRLLCNLLDGMVAVEGGKQTPTGMLFNEFPDRLADAVLIVALGFAIHMPWLGWLGAMLAICTAYVRATGGALGLPQDFRGPMAKPHRMFVLTVACLAACIETRVSDSQHALTAAAWIIALGALATCALRTRAIARQLDARG